MPEFPDIELYLHALRPRLTGQVLQRARVASPFLVRSVDPRLDAAAGRAVTGFRRLGKRIVFELADDLFLVVHLMIAGRFRWREPGAKIPGKVGLAAFDFAGGSLILTEAGSRRQAKLFVVRGEAALAEHDPGGMDVMTATPGAFGAALQAENHTLKRSLTDPHLFSGIGNAYSDEILHAAQLSPLQLTSRLTGDQIVRLHEATKRTLATWRDRLIAEAGDDFPEKVTAFREGMAAHGRFGQPCPICGTPIQRIKYASNEANYCPACQTGGKLLADRSLSRLLREDWPKSLDDLERWKADRR
jgi:formamidopyrimidine-DNA glycosylase